MFIGKGCRTKTQPEIRETCIGTSCYHMLYVGTWAKLLLNPQIKPKLSKPWKDLHHFGDAHRFIHFSLCYHGGWAPCSGNHATYNPGVTSTTTAGIWEWSSITNPISGQRELQGLTVSQIRLSLPKPLHAGQKRPTAPTWKTAIPAHSCWVWAVWVIYHLPAQAAYQLIL